jgi:hypothetical protein
MKASIDTGCKFFVFRVCNSDGAVMDASWGRFASKSLEHLAQSFKIKNRNKTFEYKIERPFLIRFTIDEDGFVEDMIRYKVEEKDCLENFYEA